MSKKITQKTSTQDTDIGIKKATENTKKPKRSVKKSLQDSLQNSIETSKDETNLKIQDKNSPKIVAKTPRKKTSTEESKATIDNTITEKKKVIKKTSSLTEIVIDNTEENKTENLVRLTKLISQLGYCSRRKAEILIKNSLVKLNGNVVKSVAILANPTDKIDIDLKSLESDGFDSKNNVFDNKKALLKNQKELNESQIRLYALYKPVGYIVSEGEDDGKKNIYSLIPRHLGRLIYIGRLDVNSEGLLLLTNNGDFAQKMTSPKSNITRIYRVRVYGFFDEKKIKRLSKGVMINGISYSPDSLELERGEAYKIGKSSNLWFTVSLKTGKNREIRKLFEHFNLTVNRLIRTNYANISLEGLRQGEIMEIDYHKIQKIQKYWSV